MKLTISRSFLLGAALGELLAAMVGVVLLLPFPFSHDLHIHLVTLGFWLCPFYMLMFMSVVQSMTAVVAIALVGNGLLYGGVGVFARFIYWLYRRCRESMLSLRCGVL
jgi:hypothetical protein